MLINSQLVASSWDSQPSKFVTFISIITAVNVIVVFSSQQLAALCLKILLKRLCFLKLSTEEIAY